MADCRDWYCGQAPHTDMERQQSETEAMYRREEEAERRARFEEAPLLVPLNPDEELCNESNAARLGRLVPVQRLQNRRLT